MITAEQLGSFHFKQDYGLRLAYVAGAMVKGIASPELVIRMGQAGMLAFYGAGGMGQEQIEAAITRIASSLVTGQAYGVNLLANPARPEEDAATVALLLRLGVRNVEASAYLQVSPALVRFRLHGATLDGQGRAQAANRIIAKLSRPQVARQFLQPAPQYMVDQLLAQGLLTTDEAALAGQLPLASDICVEADSGGHTDMGVMAVLLPAMVRLRDQFQQQYGYARPPRVGSGGGIGTPEAVACAFLLGADFIVTGSINQCTVEAGISDAVKDLLQEMDVSDTAYAPAGDMFELGARIQVLKKGLLFPARASRLYELWRNHGGLEQIDAGVRREIQEKYFHRSFEEVYAETAAYYQHAEPAELARAERHAKVKMALVFRWYFVHSMRLAMAGSAEQRTDYQIHTGPALGAYNQWVKGSVLEDWRQRRVAQIAEQLMQAGADYMQGRFRLFL